MSGIVACFDRRQGCERRRERGRSYNYNWSGEPVPKSGSSSSSGSGSAPTADRRTIETMLEAIDHRGPDGEGLWIDDGIGLGHMHHRTTPEGAFDDQPWYDEQGDLVVVADARLDNRPELFEQLPISGQPATIPDSQLLAAAYRAWGPACVDFLVGAFAFVIWDRNNERLVCARDHFGVKPIYYYRTDEVIAVASEPKALLTLPEVSTRIDETTVGDFLTGQFEDKHRSYYEPINRLEPAHRLVVDAETATRQRYWDLDPTRTLTLESDGAYERRFRELFERAVTDRLRTDAPVGTTLSGGLDSSSITAVTRALLPPDRTLRTYSGVFEDIPACDEREYIETLVGQEGIDPHYVPVGEIGLLEDIDRKLAIHEGPINNTMHYMKWEITSRAADAGVGVVLDGAHGDSAVDYGLGLLPQLARTGRWWHLGRELRQMGEILGVPARQLFRRQVVPWLVPEPIKRRWHTLRGNSTGVLAANTTIAPAFIDRTDLERRYRRFEREGQGRVRTRSARRWQYRSVQAGAMTTFLEENDLTHAAFGVEPRYPFIDKRLIEFTLAIPPTQQLADGWTRSILRRGLNEYLPTQIQWRPWKTLLNPGFQHALLNEREMITDILEEPGALTQYLDQTALSDSYDRFLETPNPRDQQALWKALSLSMWLQTGGKRVGTASSKAVVADE